MEETITKIVFESSGDILVHKTERKALTWIDLRYNVDRMSMECQDWLRQQGFVYYVFGWEGYGYGQKENGLWYKVDLKNREVQQISKEANGTSIPSEFLLGHVISPEEWGPWVFTIPLERKGIFK